MKKICFVTAARSEYGLLKWMMLKVCQENGFQMQLIVTGAHLLYEQGHTIDQIMQDGFKIDAAVDVQLDTSSVKAIAVSMGKMAEMIAPVLEGLKPDYIVVLGDRYELLPICGTAFVMRIPIIHLSGGDVTEGAIDDGIRNAVTMLASYHFPGTRKSAENIIRMRGTDRNVWVAGEPGLDAFHMETLLNREELAVALHLDIDAKWILMTYHSETIETLEYNLDAVKNCVNALLSLGEGYQIVATYSNADYGGSYINEYLIEVEKLNKSRMRVIPSLGNLKYLSLMKQTVFVIGNSSSGIIEAPILKIPVVNIGNRQRGRHLCENVIQTDNNFEAIKDAIWKTSIPKTYSDDIYYWGDGHTADKIIGILNKI